jgi:hypothetical protein
MIQRSSALADDETINNTRKSIVDEEPVCETNFEAEMSTTELGGGVREAAHSGRRRPCGAADFFFELLSSDQFSIEFDVFT